MSKMSKNRGMTLPEAMVGSFITVLVVGAGASGTMFCSKVTRKAADTLTSTSSLARARQAVLQDIRAAQSVLASASTVGIARDSGDKQLVLSLPFTFSTGATDPTKAVIVTYRVEGPADAKYLARTSTVVTLSNNSAAAAVSTQFRDVCEASFAYLSADSTQPVFPMASADPAVPTPSDRLRSEASSVSSNLKGVAATKVISGGTSDSVDYVSFILESHPSVLSGTSTISAGSRVGGK